jgi:hypothetical protein
LLFVLPLSLLFNTKGEIRQTNYNPIKALPQALPVLILQHIQHLGRLDVRQAAQFAIELGDEMRVALGWKEVNEREGLGKGVEMDAKAGSDLEDERGRNGRRRIGGGRRGRKRREVFEDGRQGFKERFFGSFC